MVFRLRIFSALLFSCAFVQPWFCQPAAFFRPVVFYSPEKGSFIETNLTVLGGSLQHRITDGRLRHSVNITLRILRDSNIVHAEKYNLHGPYFTDSLHPPAFIDCQRYVLPAGSYHIEMDILDNQSDSKKPLQVRSEIEVRGVSQGLYSSAIQPLEEYRRSSAPGPLTKSGFDLIPFNSDFYSESNPQLAFYYELYNAAATLGDHKPFVFEWHIETADDSVRLNSYSGFRKEISRPVNVLLGKINIANLGGGDYALVILTRDETGAVRNRDRHFFRRQNRKMDIQALSNLSEEQLLVSFVGKTRNADTLQMYVECLWPIADGIDKERIVDQSVKKNPDSLRRFVVDFWQRRAADTGNPLKMWAKYYRSVQEVMALFKCGKQKGYYTDRGRVYLQYGPPSSRAEQPNEPNTFPYEIWTYYRITDQVNGHFFSNRKFVFVNKSLGDDCHSLVHSDMRGEVNNPRWAFEVTRRNYDGIQNPDSEGPPNTQFNQFNEIYRDSR